MAKSIKHCSTCEENFADRFSFCPVCGTTLETAEVGSKTAFAAPTPTETAASQQQREEKHAATAIPAVTAAAADGANFVKREPVAANGTAAHVAEPVKVAPAPVIEPKPIIKSEPVVEPNSYQKLNSAIISDSEHMPHNDGMYHLTILEAPSARRRDMSYGALAGFVLLFTFLTGFWIWGLFQTNLDVEAVGDDFVLGPVYASNDAEALPEVEKDVRKNNKEDDGGGGGGGRQEQKEASYGKQPPMRPEPQLINPDVNAHVNPKAELKQSASVVGPRQPVDTRNIPFGLETSKSFDPSNGPGSGGGIGPGTGSGVGPGSGPGYGPGSNGGKGGGNNGGIGPGNGPGGDEAPPAPKREPVAAVTEPLQILSKPQPKFTEEARKQNIKGIVRLKVTFSASGQVTGIAPVQGLGGGLTEQAIAAARMIKFTPMKKNGQAVSVSKTVEYNFNMY